ncbi:MAG: type II toxin-antitoxin system Phd/YefM family antitoxin [Clostridia bacterium]|nr:type II toxin-antitoxin system Phd/YefM family antitoxin [Clostridia bacterium]
MAINASALQSLVSISQFSKGQAAKVFDRLRDESQLIVLKNNVPAAVLLSPEEYTRLAEIEENYQLLLLAQKRLLNGKLENAVTENEAMALLGITEDEVAAAEDVEIE